MPNSSSHTGHRNRLKQRLSSAGADSFLDHEFLEVLLTYSIPRKDTKTLSWTLLKHFGSIAGVLDAPESALCSVNGIGPSTARFLKLLRSAFKRYMLTKIPKRIDLRSPQEVLDYCTASLAGEQDEFIEAIFLSNHYALLETRVLSAGSSTEVPLDPRQVVKHALDVKAASVIIIHNHPSGNPNPSDADKSCTLRLARALEFFNMKLWDHLIICKGAYFSFNRHNLLPPPSQKTEEKKD